MPRLARQWQVERVLAQRWCAPLGRERDRRVAAALSVPLELCDGETLHRPGSLRTQQGKPFALQGRKFDPDGSYVRRWLPELAQLATPHLHTPWLAPGNVLAAAGLRLGRDYPLPIVDHGEARERFLRLAKTQLTR